MTSYSQNSSHHFAARRNSTSSPYAIPARPRSNSTASPYNIPERVQQNNHNSAAPHSFNPRFQYGQPSQTLSTSVPSNGVTLQHVGAHKNGNGVNHNHGRSQSHSHSRSQSHSHSSNGHGGHSNNNKNAEGVPLLTREFVVRRISEGESGRVKQELKCEACGKGYKHISSLAKHLWEHTAEWNYTKKLLISKHQQVQLLEAASILVSMNENDKIKKENGVKGATEKPIKNGIKNGHLSPTSHNSKFVSSPPAPGSIMHLSSPPPHSQYPPLSLPQNGHLQPAAIPNNQLPYLHRGSISASSRPGPGSFPNGNSVGHDSYHDELMSPSKRASFSYQAPSITHMPTQNGNSSGGGYLDAANNSNHLRNNDFMTKPNCANGKKTFAESLSEAVVDDDEEGEVDDQLDAHQDHKDGNNSNRNNNINHHEEEYEADEGVFGELE